MFLSTPIDEGRTAEKTSGVEAPADVWLQIALTGVEGRPQLARALPLLCPTLLHPGLARGVLSAEGYPITSLPKGPNENLHSELYQLIKICESTSAYLSDKEEYPVADEATYKKIATPETVHPHESYQLAKA